MHCKRLVVAFGGLCLLGLLMTEAGFSSAQQRKPRWEYARWVESPGVSIWVATGKEHYGASIFETYKTLDGTKSRADFGKPTEKDELLNHAGSQGWELCAVDTDGSTVYFFKREISASEDGAQPQRSSSAPPANRASHTRTARQLDSQAKQARSSTASAIPEDVSYTFIYTSIVPGIKRGLSVRLSRKVSEDVLRLIALELKKQDARQYDRTLIEYLLPGMKVGAGAWATSHFDPDLELWILGLTAEEERSLLNEPEDLSREVIGTWLDESPYMGNRIIIYRKDGKLFLERKFGNGSSYEMELVQKPLTRGKRFEEKEGNKFGEYYLVDHQGNLQMWDQEGLITTLRPIG